MKVDFMGKKCYYSRQPFELLVKATVCEIFLDQHFTRWYNLVVSTSL